MGWLGENTKPQDKCNIAPGRFEQPFCLRQSLANLLVARRAIPLIRGRRGFALIIPPRRSHCWGRTAPCNASAATSAGSMRAPRQTAIPVIRRSTPAQQTRTMLLRVSRTTALCAIRQRHGRAQPSTTAGSPYIPDHTRAGGRRAVIATRTRATTACFRAPPATPTRRHKWTRSTQASGTTFTTAPTATRATQQGGQDRRS